MLHIESISNFNYAILSVAYKTSLVVTVETLSWPERSGEVGGCFIDYVFKKINSGIRRRLTLRRSALQENLLSLKWFPLIIHLRLAIS